MNLFAQFMMAVILASSCGMRAWMPLFMAGVLARGGYLELNQTCAFLAREDMIVIFGIAAVLEFFADKVVGLDHAFDAIGTILRPAAGTLLASAMFTGLDPVASTTLGLVVGGGTSLAIHSGKTVLRYKVTAAIPVKGNVAASVAEDVVSGISYWAWLHAPIIAFVLAVLAVIGAAFLVVALLKVTKKAGRTLSDMVRPKTTSPAGKYQAEAGSRTGPMSP